MPTDSERKKILEMIADGTISAQDGIKLLDALDDASDIVPEVDPTPEPLPSSGAVSAQTPELELEIPEDFPSVCN